MGRHREVKNWTLSRCYDLGSYLDSAPDFLSRLCGLSQNAPELNHFRMFETQIYILWLWHITCRSRRRKKAKHCQEKMEEEQNPREWEIMWFISSIIMFLAFLFCYCQYWVWMCHRCVRKIWPIFFLLIKLCIYNLLTSEGPFHCKMQFWLNIWSSCCIRCSVCTSI